VTNEQRCDAMTSTMQLHSKRPYQYNAYIT